VGGLIVAASLVLLHEARNDRGAAALARFMLWLGISVPIGVNLASGSGYGLLGALISAWPAVAFIGLAEITIAAGGTSPRASAATSEPDVRAT
jgi:hypothetical protein